MVKKYRRALIFIVLFLIISSTTAYSALTASVKITAGAKLRTVSDIRVTNISLSSSNNAVLQYESNYDVDTISSGFTLPNAESSITYKVEVTNNGTIDQTIIDIGTQSSNNQGLYYTISEYETRDVIDFKTTKEFYITYKTTTPSNETINVVNNFVFRKVYHASYDTNGGTPIGGQNKIEGEALTLTTAEPIKAGFTFQGWTDVQGGNTVKYNSGATYAVDSDVILYAVYSFYNYEIQYNLNHGSLASGVINPTNYNINTETFTLNNPQKTVTVTGNENNTGAEIGKATSVRQQFKGWSGTGLTGESNTTVIISKGTAGDREYTAHWTPVAITLPTATKNGYTCGFNTKEDGTGTNYDSGGSYTPTANSETNINLFAKCTPKNYTITYDLDGGTVSPANPASYTIESNEITLNNPTRNGYMFTGWTGSNGNTPQTTVKISTGSTGNKNYTANWTANTYTITYNLDGGTVSPPNPTNYTILSGEIQLNPPTKTGYTFTGWTGANGNTPQMNVRISTGSTGNRTYTANYVAKEYTITLTSPYSTNSYTTEITSTYDSTALSPATIILPEQVYTISGFELSASRKSDGATVSSTSDIVSTSTFEGWYTSENGETKLLNNLATPTLQSNVSGYTDANGKWKKTDDAIVYARFTKPSKTLPTITKTGHICGWTRSSTGTTIDYASGETITISDTNIVDNDSFPLYGVCVVNIYTVEYNGNGNTGGSTASSSHTYNVAKNLTTNGFTKTNYTFAGWNTAANGSGTSYTNNQSVTNLTATNGETITLYAQWNPNIYTVTLDKQSGTGGTNTIYEKYNTGYYTNSAATTEMTTSANGITVPTREGYTFKGYYTGVNGVGVKYIDNNGRITANVSNTNFTSNTGKLYAFWQDEDKPTVTFTSSSNLKQTSQTLTLKCSDSLGVTGYYYGTTEPTSSTTYTTTAADLTNLAGDGLTETASAAGTYYLSCKDGAGNVETKGIVLNSYKVVNMLNNVSGSTYTTTDYTKASEATYIAPTGTSITLASVYTVPSGSNTNKFKGYSEGAASTTAATPSNTAPTLASNTTYTMWFTRNIIYVKYKTNGGTLQTTTHNANNTATYTWGLDSNNYITINNTNGISSFRYGVTTIDLADYNAREYMYIYKNGYTTTANQEWICESGCTTTNKVFSHNSMNLNSSNDMCNASSNDCTIVLKVNWNKRNYTLGYTLNGGTVSSANPTSYNIDSNLITLNNPTKTGYTFNGWTEQTKDLVWNPGFVNAETGIVETSSSYPNSYYTDMVRLQSGKTYTISGYASYSASNIRWIVYNLDGTKKKTVDGNTYTPDANYYVRILYFSSSTPEQRSGTIISSNLGTSATIPAGSTHNKNYVANYSGNQYTISYTLNGGTKGTNGPTSAVYGNDVQISNPSKTFTVNINANGQDATIKNASGTAVTSASSTQPFTGWTSTTVGSNALTGTAANPSTSWNGSSTKNTYFKNLKETGQVVMVANFSAANVTLPNITKTGYTCGYSTTAGGNIVYNSGDTYTPDYSQDATLNNATLFAKCIDNIAPVSLNIVNSSNGAYTNQDVLITLSAVDAGSGISEYQWFDGVEWTTNLLTTDDGIGTITYNTDMDSTIRFRVIDNAGNISDEATTTVRIDKTAPTIVSATASSDLDLRNYVDFNATDSGSKIVGYNISTSTTAPTTWIPVVSTVETTTETKYDYSASWARVFHHNYHWGTTCFTDATEAKYITSDEHNNKYSVLDNIADYKNSSNWEFLLEYPEISSTGYNRWTQTGNPVTTNNAAVGYTAVGTPTWTGNSFAGLALSSSPTNALIDGSPTVSSWYYAIGAYAPYQDGIPGPNGYKVSTVNLWSRIDNLTTTTSDDLTRRLGGIKADGTYYVWVKDSVGNTKSKSVTISNVDTTVPTATITSTNNVAASQTATLTLGDNKALDKYYWGTTNPTTSGVTYTTISNSPTSSAPTKTVSNSGTYYLSVVDKAGNRTVTNKEFYKTDLTPGRGTVTPTSVVTMSGNEFTIPTPSTVTGYTFNGWYKDSEFTTSAGTKYKPTANTTLYGKWTATPYTISTDLREGSVGTANPTSYTIESSAITLNNPTRSGYTFLGWTGSNGDTPQTTVTIAAGSTGNKSYTANWSKTVTSLTITISPESYVYDGNEKTPTVTVKDGNTTLVEGTDYTVTYLNNVNVGNSTTKPTVRVTGKSAYNSGTKSIYTGTKDIEFTITQNLVVISPPQANTSTLTYTGNALTISGTAGSCGPFATMYYYTKNYTTSSAPTFSSTSSDWSTTYPTAKATNAGTYHMWYYCYVSDTTNNTGTEINTAGDITKVIERKAVAEPSCTSATYDGTTKTLLAESTSGGYTNDAITGIKAGDYSKTLTLNSNYKWSSGSNVTSNRTKTCSIGKKSITITAKAQTVNYGTAITKTPAQVTVATLATGDTLDSITLVQSTTDATTNGTITPSAAVIKNGSSENVTSSYNITAYNTGKLTINKVNATCPTLASYTGVNDGSGHSITVTGSPVGGTLNYSTDNGSTWSTTNPSISSLGTTTVSVKVDPDSNHNVVSCYVSGSTKATVNLYNARIDFDYNGGGLVSTNPAGTNPIYVQKNGTSLYNTRTGTSAGTIPTVEKNGYTLGGWYTAETGGNQVITAGRVVNASVSGWTDANKKWLLTSHSNTQNTNTLYAHWTPTEYEITYDLQGGTLSTPNPDSYTILSDPITLNNPTKTGYTFKGWTGSNSSSPQTTVTIPTGSTGDKSYVANWQTVNYTITYDLAGGSVSSSNPSSYTIESNAFTLNNPTRTGYDFAGWTGSNDVSTGLDQYTTSSPYVAGARDHYFGDEFDVTVGETYRVFVTAKRTQGSLDMLGGIFYTQRTSGNGYDGYTGAFTLMESYDNGWGRYYKDVTIPAGKSKGKFYVILNQHSGSYTTEWLLADISVTNVPNTVTIAKGSTGDKNYTANWTANKYTITLNKNGSTNTPTASVKATYNATTISNPATITLPEQEYTISGFGLDASRKSNGAVVSSTTAITNTSTFNGWYTSSTGGSKLLSNATTPVLQASVSGYTDANSKWVKAGNTTVYARFTKNSSTLPTITKTGYVCGWTRSSSGTSITYASGETITITDPSILTDNTLTLYGVCTANTYTVNVDANEGTIPTTSGWTITTNEDSKQSARKTVTYDNTYGTLPTPTRTGYAFAGWYNAIDVDDISITAGTSNYKNVLIRYNIQPGVTYTVTIDNAILNSGTATNFSIRLYDFTDNIQVAKVTSTFGSNKTINITCPDTADRTHRLRMIIYAGNDGSTANNVVTYTGIKVGTMGTTTATAYTSSSKVNYAGTHQLYAVWNPVVYTVTLDKQSGSGGTSTIYEKYNTGYYTNSAATTQMTTSANGITIPTRTGYTFKGYYTATNGGGTQYISADGKLTANASVTNFTNNSGKLYAFWEDEEGPTVTLTSTSTLKSTSQTLTLKCTDTVGVTGYYYGTTAPTSSTTYTTTSADITSLAGSGLTKTVSAAGTYYLSCKDGSGNVDTKNVVLNSYRVINMLNNVSGSTYTTTHYTSTSDNTYIAPKNTTLTLSGIRTVPTGSNSNKFKGYSVGEPSETAATMTTTNPSLTANSVYTLWFTRNIINVRYKANGGTLQASTHNADNTSTATWGFDSNNYITRNNSASLGSWRYEAATMDLYNYNNREGMYIYRNGYTTTSGKEWICESGCTANQTFPHAGNTTPLCDASSNDCTAVVKVNWTRRNYSLGYVLNGGTVSTANPTSYNVDSSTIALNNPTRSGYTFDGWTEEIKNLVWWSGFATTSSGHGGIETNSSYPNSHYTDMIRLKSGVTYTLSGYGEYPADNIRWRVYDLDESYVKNISGATYTPDADYYVRILFYNAPTADQRSGAVITSSAGTTATIPAGSTHNRVYTAMWSKSASSLTVTLDPTSYTYDGTAKTPTVTVKDGNTTLTEDLDYTIGYSNNTNAGTAKVTITGTGIYNTTTNSKYTGSKEVSFTIARQSVDFPTCTAKTYSGSSQTLFSAHSSGPYTNSALTGTTVSNSYTVSLTPSANYQWSSGSNVTSARTLTCAINQYTPSIALSASSGSVYWNSTKTFTATPTVIDACKGTLTAESASTTYVAIESGASTENATSAVSVKWKGVLATTGTKINVNYTPTDTTNCASATKKVYTATVNTVPESNITVSLEPKSAQYTGSAIAANTASASPNGGGSKTYLYYTDNTCTTKTTTSDSSGATATGGAPKNVGNYYVQAKVAGVSGKTEDAYSACTAHTITKSPTTTTLAAITNTFNGSTQAATGATAKLNSNDSAISGGSYTYTYYSNSSCTTKTNTSDGSGATTTGGAPKNAGTYYVKATLAASDNYNKSTSECMTYTMNKYKPEITLSASSGTRMWSQSRTFTATPTVITACKGTLTAASASTTYVTIESGASTENATSAVSIKWKAQKETSSSGTKINVNYTPTDTANCDNATQKQYTAKVNVYDPITVNLTAKSASQRTYTGSAIAANTATVTPNSSPTITYKYYTNSTCTQGETSTAPTNVGTYYVKAHAEAKTGQTVEGYSDCINHSIVKSDTTTSLAAITNTFNNNTQAATGATAKLNSNDSAISGGSYTYKYYTNSSCTEGETSTAPKNAGTYYVKATLAAANNYNGSTSGCAKYTMNKYKPEITLSASSGTRMWHQTRTFTATPTVITACKGTLTAASASTTYVTIESGASTENATDAVSIKWKAQKETSSSGTKINVNYTPTDTANCDNATQKQYTAKVNVYDPITVNLTAKSATYTGSAIAANTATVTPNSNPTITYKYYTNSTCTQGETSTAPTNVGTYYVIAHANPVPYETVAGDSACTTHTITKKTPTLSLNSYSGTLTYETNKTINVTTDGDGPIGCDTSDDTVATCTVSGTTVTVTPLPNTEDGKTATIEIWQDDGTNYNGNATHKEYIATVNRKTLTCPSSPSDKLYTGESISSGITCPDGSTAGGHNTKTAVGNYTRTCTANSGYKFSGNTTDCSVDWSIVYPEIDFETNSCGTLSGTDPIYTKTLKTNVYTGPQNSTGATIPKMTKAGYTFNGWYTKASNGTKVIAYDSANDDVSVVASISGWTGADKQWLKTANSVLYAQCTANTYSIKFDGNGANSGSMSNQSMTYDVADNLTDNAYTRYGYDFAGWATSASGSVVYEDGESVSNLATSDTKTLYAKWTEKTYQFTIDPRGGTYNGSSNVSVTTRTYSNPILLTKPKPTRANYNFSRWYYFDNNVLNDTSPSFASTNNGLVIYDNNNTGTGTIALQRLSGTNPVTNPSSSYLMKLTKSSSSTSATKPGLGGFVDKYFPAANGRFAHVILARKTTSDPLYIQYAHNGLGTGGSAQWLTGNEVTTSWKVFVYTMSTGTTTPGSVGFIYFTKTPEANSAASTGGFTLEIAYSGILDTSDNDNNSRGYGIGQYDGSGYLAATWKPKVYKVNLNNQSATSAGTTKIYETYNTGYFRDSGGSTTPMQGSGAIGITKPVKTGYSFQGYYMSTNGAGKKIIDSDGNLVSGLTNKEFTGTGTIYAKWNKNSATTYSCRYVYTQDKSGSPYCYVSPNYYTYASSNFSSGECDINPNGSGAAICKSGTVIGPGWSVSEISSKCSGMGDDWSTYTSTGSSFYCMCSDSPTYHVYETITTSYMSFTTKPTACYLGTSCTVQCK